MGLVFIENVSIMMKLTACSFLHHHHLLLHHNQLLPKFDRLISLPLCCVTQEPIMIGTTAC